MSLGSLGRGRKKRHRQVRVEQRSSEEKSGRAKEKATRVEMSKERERKRSRASRVRVMQSATMTNVAGGAVSFSAVDFYSPDKKLVSPKENWVQRWSRAKYSSPPVLPTPQQLDFCRIIMPDDAA